MNASPNSHSKYNPNGASAQPPDKRPDNRSVNRNRELWDALCNLQGCKKAGDGYMARCPAHNDQTPSLKVTRDAGGIIAVYCHAGCSWKDILAVLGFESSDLFPPKAGHNRRNGHKQGEGVYIPSDTTATLQHSPDGCTLAAYAEVKGLPLEFLRELGLSDISYQSASAIRMPYLGVDGTVAATRYRTALYKSEQSDDRFRWKAGSKPLPYGLWRLADAREAGYITVVEGESDCHTLWLRKQPALGIPGADTWKEAWAAYLNDIPTIYVVIEPDRGGETIRKWIAASQIKERTKLIELGTQKDPSGLYLSDPDGFDKAWQSALAGATSWTEAQRSEAETKASEEWETCKELATAPDILSSFVVALAHKGLAGEWRAAKLIYLAVTSRCLDHPVSIAVKGPSSAGKSYTVEQVLAFFPATAYYALSAMSERSLAYSKEPLQHRILVIYEAAGLSGDMASYLVRSLLSEGKVRYETVEKTKDGLQPRLIEREGPTGLIVTTTAVHLHPENETRLLSLTVTDTQEQTRKVLLALARDSSSEGSEGDVNIAEWYALQEWLAGAEHRVAIPYGDQLAKLTSTVAVRLRRDFRMVLNLIKTHAILHQATRERDRLGRIVASIADYSAIRELVADLVAEGVDATVSNAMRETVRAVEELCKATGDTISVSQLAKHLKLDKGTVSRRAGVCIDRGYLRNEEARQGKPYKLRVGDPLPEDQEILPHPDRLISTKDNAEGCCSVAVLPGGISIPPTLIKPHTVWEI